MRLVLISDNHDQNLKTKWEIPDGDVLIHVGDLVGTGIKPSRFIRGAHNLRRFPHRHKLYVPGNHDYMAYTAVDLIRPILEAQGITVLFDQAITIDGVQFYGSSWLHPTIGLWGEYRAGPMTDVWHRIPENTDVLLTHSPPSMILDWSNLGNDHIGCPTLISEIMYRVKPKLHVFGHAHEDGCRTATYDGVQFVNAALCDEFNRPAVRHPVVVDLEPSPAGDIRSVSA